MKFVLHTSEVKLAHHFAVRRNFTHGVNFTIKDNFTCPKGKLSFSDLSAKDKTLMVCWFFGFHPEVVALGVVDCAQNPVLCKGNILADMLDEVLCIFTL